MLAALLAVLQVTVPPPRGYVNDFAGVLDAASVARMEAVIAEVRERTSGEIAVVTLADIGDRAPSDVALQIGREWGVGARAEAGDPTKNVGVVILLVPLKDHRSGTGAVFIATGRGAEGFLPDARVGRIRDAMIPDLAREAYGAGLTTGVEMVAAVIAEEFGVTLTGELRRAPPVDAPGRRVPSGWVLALFLLLVILSRGRILLWPFMFGGMGGRHRGRWGGWGGGGGRGGFGGGGFGGFGGGGGFSGGGAGGRF
ncbi:MAG: TPM domain-containing protein [Gemmatimonadales bacterium]|nr:TPM domain-containing protein [Gemmatimonadales bacterium]